jgi:integrase
MATTLPRLTAPASEPASTEPAGNGRVHKHSDDEQCAKRKPRPPRRIRVAESVYQRPDPKTGKPIPGKFEFVYRDATHRQIWQKATGSTKAEAVAERAELMARMSLGERIERTNLTVGEVARLWIERGTGPRGQWDPSTKDRYQRLLRSCVDQPVIPRLRPLGEVKLRDLTVDRVAQWSAANERTMAPTTARFALGLLNQVCRHALRRGWLAVNPVTLLETGERPRGDAQTVAILQGPHLARLLDHSNRYRPIFELLAYTGLRISEALGLRWSDVDFERGVLRIRQQLGPDRVPKRLKTKAAEREVILAAPIVALLRKQQSAWPERCGDNLVFCTRNGLPYHHSHIGEEFRAAVNRAGLQHNDRLSLHSLRHSYASMLIAAGLNVVFVSRQLGHANSSITLSVYAHLFAAAEHADTARTAIEANHRSLGVETAVETNVPPGASVATRTEPVP